MTSLSVRTVAPLALVAMTFGHVVVGASARMRSTRRVGMNAHVRQHERWDPLSVPAYLASSAWALACGQHVYLDHSFECTEAPDVLRGDRQAPEAFRLTD
jgi:hypothetical protein